MKPVDDLKNPKLLSNDAKTVTVAIESDGNIVAVVKNTTIQIKSRNLEIRNDIKRYKK